ncbi:hypothetical protein BB560_003571 [Smittium megazygosporum]|uniref:Uncharacterized protein n=1 Tax=Smittium megazygosporum TaxID=133381 RepID=A0A2T9ZBK5_9FUNG|nr:hypothetical protein BB560_003571 [Smittium megazygosporum]
MQDSQGPSVLKKYRQPFEHDTILYSLKHFGLNLGSPKFQKKLEISPKDFISQILIYMNLFLATRPENKLSVLGCSPNTCKFLIPSQDDNPESTFSINIESPQIRKADETLLSGILSLLSEFEPDFNTSGTFI